MENIFNYSKSDLEEFLVNNNYPKYMASQIFDWIYDKKEYNFDNFLNIKKENREFLKKNFSFDFIKIIKVEEDIDTKKFLFQLLDNNYIEAVLMKHNYGLSVCISSEVGCNMGCKFCESGRLKKIRNLEIYEMLEQIILINKYIKNNINSVVIMGIGEPFDNYDNVLKFIKMINDNKVLAIGSRHITVSTCGIVPKIKEFMNEKLQVNLAISLHAPNDEIRNKIMPINKAYPINELISTLKEYNEVTGRRITIEYVLLEGINDTRKCALELAQIVKKIHAYVNLIPYNVTNNIDFKATSKENIDKFYDYLKKENINVTVRRRYGTKISAACGQLRSKQM